VQAVKVVAQFPYSKRDMDTQPATQPETSAIVPKKRGGPHKPDCACGWCRRIRENKARADAKKNATTGTAGLKQNASSETPKPAVIVSGSGESSKASSAPSSPKKDMARKIATRASTTAPVGTSAQNETTTQRTEKSAAVAQPAKVGWFERLMSGPLTFFGED
jgi:hypothetical protein